MPLLYMYRSQEDSAAQAFYIDNYLPHPQKMILSELKVMDLIIFIFFFIFFIFLFLELRVRVSHVAQRKKIKESRRIISYNIYTTYIDLKASI